MKIAIFVDAFPVWTETFIINQMTGLIDRGHDIEIYATGRRESDSQHAVIDRYNLVAKTHFLSDQPKNISDRIILVLALLFNDGRWKHLRTWSVFFNILKGRRKALPWNTLGLLSIALPNVLKKPYDILHCQFGTLGPRVLFLKQIGALHGKLVTSFRGHDATQERYVNSNLYKELFMQGDLFFPVSRNLADRLIVMGCPEGRIKVLHSGIDCKKFIFNGRALINNELPKVVTIARFVEMKGLEFAIKAISLLVSNGYEVSYTIIGDGILRPELENLIKSLNISEFVVLAGWKNHEEIVEILESSHILLAPSVTAKNGETEGIPNAVKEAMAMGMPVLSTIHSGIPELVQDKVSGYLVAERDEKALAERLMHLIDHSVDWSKMGSAGRNFVESEFDIEKLNTMLENYYEN